VDARVLDASGSEKNLMLPPGVITAGENGPEPALTDPYAVETDRAPKTHRLRPHPASRLQETFPNTGPGGAITLGR
jgi:hypothetical protein